MPAEPCGDDVGGVAGLDRDGDAGCDLDHADDVHRVERAQRAEVVDPWGEVVLPVDEGVGELVDAHHDRQHREADAQKDERLVGGILARRSTACCDLDCSRVGALSVSTDMVSPFAKVVIRR